MNHFGLSLLVVTTLGIGCAHHHPNRDMALNRCQTLIEVLDSFPPETKRAKLVKECDYLLAHDGCRHTWRTRSGTCEEGTNASIMATCAPAYCSDFDGETPAACAEKPSAAAWSQLYLAILAHDIGGTEAGLLHSVLSRYTLCDDTPQPPPRKPTIKPATEPATEADESEHSSCSE
jgi:hypothetical protein